MRKWLFAFFLIYTAGLSYFMLQYTERDANVVPLTRNEGGQAVEVIRDQMRVMHLPEVALREVATSPERQIRSLGVEESDTEDESADTGSEPARPLDEKPAPPAAPHPFPSEPPQATLVMVEPAPLPDSSIRDRLSRALDRLRGKEASPDISRPPPHELR